LWRNSWEQFIPFLDYDVQIRKVLCSTNAIESLNARYRRAVNAKGHFSTEQAGLKTLVLVTRCLGRHDGSPGGRRPWTPSPSPPPTECRQRRTSDETAGYTVYLTDPSSTVRGCARSKRVMASMIVGQRQSYFDGPPRALAHCCLMKASVYGPATAAANSS
jgi:mutator family transposase